MVNGSYAIIAVWNLPVRKRTGAALQTDIG